MFINFLKDALWEFHESTRTFQTLSKMFPHNLFARTIWEELQMSLIEVRVGGEDDVVGAFKSYSHKLVTSPWPDTSVPSDGKGYCGAFSTP